MASINPATGKVMKEFECHSEKEVERRLQRAVEAFAAGRRAPPAARAPLMTRAASILESEKRDLARLMTLEMGKPLRAAVQEVEKCALACDYYARNAARFLADEAVTSSATRSLVRYQPLGPVLAVMPWNFPFWQVFRFAAPGLMAGNVGLLKHASNVPQCALAIEDLFRRAGFAEGVFQALLVGSERVAPLIEDPRVVAVTLTGSLGAGSSVAAAAGRHIKKTVLELGGSDPFIVMPSADLDRAVATAVQARTINNGQSCIAAKRFILHERIAEQFERRFVERMAALKVGDPMDETTDIGPLATVEVLETLEKQVNQTVAMGAQVLLGGRRLDRSGSFFEPTVLARIPPKRRRSGKSCSARSPRFSAPATWKTPCASPTTPSSGWAPAPGPTTRRNASCSSSRSRPAWPSSTRWSPPTRGSPSAESSSPATAASWAATACSSSSTLKRSQSPEPASQGLPQ